MSNEAQKEFISNAKKEVQQRINTENKAIIELNKEKTELIEAIRGYDAYNKELKRLFIECMQNFTVTEEDLPKYFKSNISESYENYVQIRLDAIEEINTLKKYISHCKREINNNKRKLKFYKSQYLDSDFFEECLPLVELYQQKIDLYKENIQLTEKTIEQLLKIVKKLKNWK
jgi:hypothetical protein